MRQLQLFVRRYMALAYVWSSDTFDKLLLDLTFRFPPTFSSSDKKGPRRTQHPNDGRNEVTRLRRILE